MKACVEISEIPRSALGFQQDSGDEKAGENEEDVDAGPAGLHQRLQCRICRTARLEADCKMPEHHDEDREAANPVQRRHVAIEQWRVVSAGNLHYPQ